MFGSIIIIIIIFAIVTTAAATVARTRRCTFAETRARTTSVAKGSCGDITYYYYLVIKNSGPAGTRT